MVLLAIGGFAVWQLIPRGGDPDPIQLSAPAAPTSTAGTGPTTTLPPEEFTYRVGILSGISTDNYWAFYGGMASVWNAYILGPTKPALYAHNPSTGGLDNELATEMAVPVLDGDGWSVMIPLNETMTWSDGVPITAYDVAYTFETVRAAGLGGSWETAFPDVVEDVVALSPFELRIIFEERPMLAVWPHGPGMAPIMPAHVWQQHTADLSKEDLYALSGDIDVGGGPLWIRDIAEDSIISEANPGYPYGNTPTQVVYRVFENEDGAVAALGANEIDTILSPQGLTDRSSRLAATLPSVTVQSSPSNGIRYLGFNLTRAPMSDQAFRTALALLIDRDALAASIPEMGTAAYSFVNPADPVWYDHDAASAIAQQYSGDLELRLATAVDGLEEIGYRWTIEPSVLSDGTVRAGQGLTIRGTVPPMLTILTPGDAYDPHRPEYATQIATALSWLGFAVEPVVTDFDSVIDVAFTPGGDGTWQYDMYLLGWTLGSPALPAYYRPLFSANGELNNTGYDSAEFAEQLARYEGAYTYDEARAALWEIEATLAADLPYLLLYTSQISEAYRSDRVLFGTPGTLGGLQGRLGAISDVLPVQ